MSEETDCKPIRTVNLIIVCATFVTITFLICYYVAHCNGFKPTPVNPTAEKQ